MRTLLLAAAASAALAFPALAQTTTQPTPPPATPQIQPNDQAAHPAMKAPPGANMQAIAPNTLSRQQVMRIQQALDKNGFSAGRADGIWGPETRSALMNFQKSKNMGAANGELDTATLSALQLKSDQFGMSAAPSGGMSGATGANSASTGNSTGGANTSANAANGGMKGATANKANHTTGAKPGTSKTTP